MKIFGKLKYCKATKVKSKLQLKFKNMYCLGT